MLEQREPNMITVRPKWSDGVQGPEALVTRLPEGANRYFGSDNPVYFKAPDAQINEYDGTGLTQQEPYVELGGTLVPDGARIQIENNQGVLPIGNQELVVYVNTDAVRNGHTKQTDTRLISKKPMVDGLIW